MSTQTESVTGLIELMRRWQKIEDTSVKNTTEIIKKTDNPIVHLVMEIIRQDSVMHRRVQQLIADHYERKPLTLSPEELDSFWDLIEEHDELEKKTVELAREAMENTKSQMVKYLLSYLLADESKHDKMLENMDLLKRGLHINSGF